MAYAWLQKLLGELPHAAFLTRYFGERWLYQERPAGPGPFDGLVTLHDLELLLFDGARRDRLFHAVGGQGDPAQETDAPNHHCSADEALDEWAAGKTLIFNGIDRQLPAVNSLARGLEGELKCRVWCNLYLTPAGGHGFITHYDSHDVFILHLLGSKRWRVGAHAVDAPMPFQGHEDMPGIGRDHEELQLRPGDVLYLPRGALHDAAAEDDLSCHLTIGLHPKTYLDAILTAVTLAADRDPQFRRHLPPGAFDIGSDIVAESRRLMSLVEDNDFSDVGQAFCELLASQRRRSPIGLLEIQGEGGAFATADRFRATAYLMSSLSIKGGKAELHALGRLFQFPESQAADLELCCGGRVFRLSDLHAQASEHAAETFLRRLVMEGIVQRLDATDDCEPVQTDFIRHAQP